MYGNMLPKALVEALMSTLPKQEIGLFLKLGGDGITNILSWQVHSKTGGRTALVEPHFPHG